MRYRIMKLCRLRAKTVRREAETNNTVMVKLLKAKGNDGFNVTVDDVLAMPQHVRQDKITRVMAEQLGLIYIDGAGGPQFVGTTEEQEARMSSARRLR